MSVAPRKIYSISDLTQETGISRRNVIILLEQFADSVPTLMDGEKRKYPPEAISALKRLWRQYNSGVEQGETESNEWFEKVLSGLSNATTMLSEASGILRDLNAQLRKNRPRRVYYINSLPGPDYDLVKPIAVMVDETRSKVLARLDEADLEAEGKTAKAAVIALREVMVRAFGSLSRDESLAAEESDQLAILSSLIRRKDDKKRRRD
jgi:hypothetical protein